MGCGDDTMEWLLVVAPALLLTGQRLLVARKDAPEAGKAAPVSRFQKAVDKVCPLLSHCPLQCFGVAVVASAVGRRSIAHALGVRRDKVNGLALLPWRDCCCCCQVILRIQVRKMTVRSMGGRHTGVGITLDRPSPSVSPHLSVSNAVVP